MCNENVKEVSEAIEENFDEDVITLQTADGLNVDFLEIAGIEHEGNFYSILQPVELLEGMEEDEALVFLTKDHPDGGMQFELCLDDDIIDAVFAEYHRLLDEEEQE